jgi:hypothetical protein
VRKSKDSSAFRDGLSMLLCVFLEASERRAWPRQSFLA